MKMLEGIRQYLPKLSVKNLVYGAGGTALFATGCGVKQCHNNRLEARLEIQQDSTNMLKKQLAKQTIDFKHVVDSLEQSLDATTGMSDSYEYALKIEKNKDIVNNPKNSTNINIPEMKKFINNEITLLEEDAGIKINKLQQLNFKTIMESNIFTKSFKKELNQIVLSHNNDPALIKNIETRIKNAFETEIEYKTKAFNDFNESLAGDDVLEQLRTKEVLVNAIVVNFINNTNEFTNIFSMNK